MGHRIRDLGNLLEPAYLVTDRASLLWCDLHLSGPDPMKRFALLLTALALASSAVAADKPVPRAKAARQAGSLADFDKDGDPNLRSTAALVLDAKTGETLF